MLARRCCWEAGRLFAMELPGATERSRSVIGVIHVLEGSAVDGSSLQEAPVVGLLKRDDQQFKEVAYTSLLAAELQSLMPRVGEHETRWCHQMTERSGGELDIALYEKVSELLLHPVMVVDVGVNVAWNAKRTQARAYAVNVSSQLRQHDVLLVVELILRPKDRDSLAWMTVSAAMLSLEAGGMLEYCTLWSGGCDARSVEALLQTCEAVAARNSRGVEHTWRPLGRNVGLCLRENLVYKAYDYRGRNVAKEQRRDHSIALERIPGCRVVMEDEECVVIAYPRVEGTHQPSQVSHFIALIEQVVALHNAGLVHGDLRLFNVVFCENGSAQLIDFDFSGENVVKCYPKGFVAELPDGKRHKRASAGKKLRVEHDCFALAALMEMFTCQDDQWRNATAEVGGCGLAGALQILERIGNEEELSATEAEAEGKKATGKKATDSPPRK